PLIESDGSGKLRLRAIAFDEAVVERNIGGRRAQIGGEMIEGSILQSEVRQLQASGDLGGVQGAGLMDRDDADAALDPYGGTDLDERCEVVEIPGFDADVRCLADLTAEIRMCARQGNSGPIQ